jgi:mannosyltransferase
MPSPTQPAAGRRWSWAWTVVAVLAGAGAVLRLDAARQSLLGDELSTFWLVSDRGLFDMVEFIHDTIELTPPFSFVLSWLTTRTEVTPELLRAPALLAGVATIPLAYALGARLAGRLPGLVAAALVAFSPFLIFYSSEARGYQVVLLLAGLSTLALLNAAETGRSCWWAAYAACSCLAMYTHYTAAFVLAGQALWALWAHPERRRPLLLANLAAGAAFAPWIPGMINDFDHPDQEVMDILFPFTPFEVRLSVSHWAVGHPVVRPATELRDLPGIPGLVLMGLGLVIALAAAALATLRGARPDRRLVLVAILAVATPAGSAAMSALGSSMFAARNLTASWIGYALALATLLVAAGPRLRLVTVGLVVAGFAIAGTKMLGDGVQRPDFRAAGDYIDRQASPLDPVVNAAAMFLTPGPVTPLDATLVRPHRVMRVGAPERRNGNFRPGDHVPTAEQVAALATASGRRVFVLIPIIEDFSSPEGWDQLLAGSATPYRRVGERLFDGFTPLAVLTYAPR